MSESESRRRDRDAPLARDRARCPDGCAWSCASSLGLLGLAASAALAVVLIAGIALAVSYPNLPEIGSLTDYRPKLPMRVFSADGVLLGEFGEERRNFVPIARDPEGDAGRGARGRGRALLQAQRRQLRRA